MSVSALRLLIVEDDAFQRWTLEQHLVEMGVATIASAANGRLALEVLCTRPFDVVISDLDMPGMDGMEFMRHLTELADPPQVVVMSAHHGAILSSMETMAAAYGVRLLGTIEKPPTCAKLAAVLGTFRAQSPVDSRAGAPEAAVASPPEIAAAIAARRIVAWFQPKVDARTRRIVGAEALARWVLPSGEVLVAERFIANVEAARMLPQLTETVVAQACAGCAQWLRAGVRAKVSFNIPPGMFTSPDVAEALTATVGSHGLVPADVVIEVTESGAAMELGAVLENLARLRMRGFGLAVDDFGTGHSSLQQLTRVAFSELKIHPTFVRKAATQPAFRAAVESSVAIARRLGLQAVAEGVETQADWQLVRELGCDMAQGRMLGQPMPLTEFVAAALRNRA